MILKIFWERSNRSWSGPYEQWSSMWSKSGSWSWFGSVTQSWSWSGSGSEFRYSLVYHNGEI